MTSLTCTNHCSQCGRHFHSLRAFDIHHDHDETGWPVCLDPLDLLDRGGAERLVALGAGECRMYEPQFGVTVWTIADFGWGSSPRRGAEDCREAVCASPSPSSDD